MKKMASDQQPLHQEPSSPGFAEESPKKQCCYSYCCYKALIVIYGFFFFIIGLILVGFGVYLLWAKSEIEGVNTSLTIPAVIGLLVGIIMLITALCGILGALKENLIALRIFLAVIIIVFLVQVTCGIVAFVKREQAEHILQGQLTNGVKLYHNKQAVRYGMDFIQNKFDCCGADGIRDWNQNDEYKCGSGSTWQCSLPKSCCPQDQRDQPECGLQARKNFTGTALKERGFSTEGCYWQFRAFVEHNLDNIGATALGFAILHILGCFCVYIFITKVEDRIYLFKYRERYYPEHY